MVALSGLWLPIVLSAVAVFIVSAIVHMALPTHKKDYAKLPDEDRVMEALRAAGVKPGAYMFPFCSSGNDFKDPAVQAKFEKGPVGIAMIMPSGTPAMGPRLALWFVYCLAVSFFSAYLAGRLLPPAANYLTVFRVVGTVAFMAYGVGQGSDSIWKAQPWSTTIKNVFDGLVYGLVTAGMFGWLWPR